MLKNKKIGFIGGGNMGEALIGGLINSSSAAATNIICADTDQNRTEFLKNKYKIQVTENNLEVVQSSDIIIYAVKPQIISTVLEETAQLLSASKLIISIVAGVPLAALEALLDKEVRLIRVMPNVAALVGEGATAVTASKHALKEDIQIAMAIFESIGQCLHIKEDALMDAVTGLSGSGPAYIFSIFEALADGGVKMGLSRQEAVALTAQTIMGAVKLFNETQKHPGQLKDMVTSPAGTTIYGLHALEKGKLRSTLIDAVEAATQRSKELGNQVIEKFKKQTIK